MRDYRDFIKFKINKYSEEIGIPIDKSLWHKFENYFPFNNERIDLNINFYTSREGERLSFYNFDISYPISSTRACEWGKYKLVIRHIDYLTYLRTNKIDSLFS